MYIYIYINPYPPFTVCASFVVAGLCSAVASHLGLYTILPLPKYCYILQ